ncbi:MAG TPA: hypothetical protein VMA72_30020 [Streptosporangiaceae bacterium]|nr:hypothetical protein [Streptosporangiaceae bacterium]
MRYRLMATYRGSPFEAGIGPTNEDIVLFAACPPPEELGFEPATGHWRKQLRFADVQAVWESRPVGTFRGQRCMVLDDLGDRLHIGYLGHDGYKAAELGYWQVDRGVFELVAPRSEVSDIVEERTEYARPASRTDASEPLRRSPQPASQQGQEWPSSPVYPVERRPDSAAYTIPAGLAGRTAPPVAVAGAQPPGYQDLSQDFSGEPGPYLTVPAPDDTTGVALPIPAEAPLPLEAEALRAATAARRPRQAAARSRAAMPSGQQRSAAPPAPPAGQRRAARPRMATEALFAELASLAGIPADSYAVGEEVDGAMCLLQTDHGFEVFHSAGGARHELQAFATEESACFYLFGLLAAEAVRNGTLMRAPASRLA